jgi:hypothetical protein
VPDPSLVLPLVLRGEQKANLLAWFTMARRPAPETPAPDVLSEEELKQLRHNLAHLSIDGVRRFYEDAYADCRLLYDRTPALERSRHSSRCGSSCGSGGGDES